MIGLWIFARPLQSQVKHIQTRPLPSIGVGLLTFIVAFPIVLIIVVFLVFIIFILLLLQLDGLLLTLVSGGLLGTLVGAISVFFFVAIFVSRIIVCLWAGLALWIIWLLPEERNLLAKHGVAVSHNPASNLMLGSGAMPFADYRARGDRFCALAEALPARAGKRSRV